MKKKNRVAFFNILGTLLLKGISIFTAPLFSRLLGTSGYGVTSIYSIMTGGIAIAFPLQTQGTLVNARVEYTEEAQNRYQSSVMTLSVLSFMAFSALLLIFRDPFCDLLKMNHTLVWLMLLQAFGTFSVSFLSTKFVYEMKAGRNMAISLGVTLTTLVLSVILVLSFPAEVNYYGRILAISLTYGVIGIPACIWILAKGKTFYNRDYWKFCMLLAIPTVCYNLSDLILGQSDRVMLQNMLDASAVGQYSLALNFAGIMFTIFGALNQSWTPFFFDDFKKGDLKRVRDSAGNFLELYTVLCAGFLLLTREVYHVFAAEEFWTGTNLIWVFVTSYFANFLCTFPVNFEYYYKKTKIVAVITISCSLVNIALNYVLIRSIGMAGAAVATMISHGLQLTMHHIYCRYILGKGNYPFGLGVWWKYAVAFTAAVAGSFLLEDMALARWGIGAAIGLWELYRIKKRKVLL